MKTKLLTLLLTAVHLHFAASSRAGGDYVAHEWGTFTSVQAADGIQLEWNPLITTDLPSFVYDRTRRPFAGYKDVIGFGAKGVAGTLQRMETPVIYFYSGREQKVDVTVNFPQGNLTEWYPQVAQAHNATNLLEMSSGRQTLRWNDVRVFPQRANPSMSSLLPLEKSGSHYYAARDTDADFLHVTAAGQEALAGEVEKFLFYRGVGNFRAPLTVTLAGDSGEVNLQNTGKENLPQLFIYAVRDGGAKFVPVEGLASGATRKVKFDVSQNFRSLPEVHEQLAARMQRALVREGLYEREAAAMVKTWEDSWFAEPGVRVLYTLPRAWTDRILPLTLDPEPRELVRVMVGRAEVLTPSMEWELMKQIVRFSDSDERVRAGAIKDARQLGLGRFMEPATRRLMAKMPAREFNQFSWGLLQAASKPSGEGKPLAAR